MRLLQSLTNQGSDTIRQSRPAAQFSKTAVTMPKPAPRLGQHSVEILSEIDFSKDEITALIDSQIVFQYLSDD